MTQYKLTRDQEQRLVVWALQHLIADVIITTNGNGHDARRTKQYTNGHASPLAVAITPKGGWTAKRRKAFSKKMVAVWDKKRRADKTPAKKHGYASTAAIHARRAKSAQILAKYATDTPRPAALGGKSVAPLVRRGYLKKSGDGYIRTAKTFTP